jgi:KUP system potassium uptake protein
MKISPSDAAVASVAPRGAFLAALGVVYGDIGTSPLYALRECFGESGGVAPTPGNVLGLVSLVLWALIVVVTVKYVALVMRADNRGEGGVLALMALVSRALPVDYTRRGHKRSTRVLLLGMVGAALFYGDGIITPAISVLSAVEGLEIAAPFFSHLVVPLALGILIGLFALQEGGTAKVGALFGPIMLVWFATLALLGAVQIAAHPSILAAISPLYAMRFVFVQPLIAFVALAAVVLVVTGGEALYADMGHFGRTPIARAWLFLVLPALMLNYLGQGALIIENPALVSNPFYALAPSWALWPLVLLATVATVIASQAVISGVFSLTHQAIALDLLPRLEILHTSASAIGQIYVPVANWLLCAGVVALVLGFGSSSALANAYGIAVTGTMTVTTLLLYAIMRHRWQWSVRRAAPVTALLLVVDLLFLSSNLLKIDDGGGFPLLLGGAALIVMLAWRAGRARQLETLTERGLPLEAFIARLREGSPLRVPGTAIYMARSIDEAPLALLHNLKHNKSLHERVVLLTVRAAEVPTVRRDERVVLQRLQKGFLRITLTYGFMEQPDVPQALGQCGALGESFDIGTTSFFVGREKLVQARRSRLRAWQRILYFWLSRNAQNAADFFNIPPNRVVELGAQIEL